MNIIIANYGNESLALIQWAWQQAMPNLLVLSVDTGWEAQDWQAHRLQVFRWMEERNIIYQHLNAQLTMAESILDRKQFPSKKFQWCAPFLKGLTLNKKLDEIDKSFKSHHFTKVIMSSEKHN